MAAAHTHRVVVDSPIGEVWKRLQSADTWQDIGPVEQVWDPTHGDEGELLGYHWSTAVGGQRYHGSARTITSHSEENMMLSLDGEEVSALLTASLDPADDGESTSLQVTIEIEPKGTMGTLFFPVISAAIRNGLRDHLEAFARSTNGRK